RQERLSALPFNSEIVTFAVAALGRLGRTKQKKKVLALRELVRGGDLEKPRTNFEGIIGSHGFGLQLLFFQALSKLDLPAILFLFECNQDDFLDPLTLSAYRRLASAHQPGFRGWPQQIPDSLAFFHYDFPDSGALVCSQQEFDVGLHEDTV